MANGSLKPIAIAGGLVLVLVAATALYFIDRQRPVDEESQREFDENMLATTLDLQDQLTGVIDEGQLAEEKARAESELGLKLFGFCNAWAEFSENHPSESNLENRERACSEYRRYLKTGEIPESDASGEIPSP